MMLNKYIKLSKIQSICLEKIVKNFNIVKDGKINTDILRSLLNIANSAMRKKGIDRFLNMDFNRVLELKDPFYLLTRENINFSNLNILQHIDREIEVFCNMKEDMKKKTGEMKDIENKFFKLLEDPECLAVISDKVQKYSGYEDIYFGKYLAKMNIQEFSYLLNNTDYEDKPDIFFYETLLMSIIYLNIFKHSSQYNSSESDKFDFSELSEDDLLNVFKDIDMLYDLGLTGFSLNMDYENEILYEDFIQNRTPEHYKTLNKDANVVGNFDIINNNSINFITSELKELIENEILLMS